MLKDISIINTFWSAFYDAAVFHFANSFKYLISSQIDYNPYNIFIETAILLMIVFPVKHFGLVFLYGH